MSKATEQEQLPKNIRRSLDKINKNMTPEMRKQIAEKAELANEARTKTNEYHMDTQNFISAHAQFLTSIINGKTQHHGAYSMDFYADDYGLAADMAANYVMKLGEYKTGREDNMPNYSEGVQ